jgi:hypothetical protein
MDILSTLADIEYVSLRSCFIRIELYVLIIPLRSVRYKFKADADTTILPEYGDVSLHTMLRYIPPE